MGKRRVSGQRNTVLTGESVTAVHDVFMLFADFFVDIIADKQIHIHLFQRSDNPGQLRFIQPIVGIQHLEILAGSMAQARHDRVAMSAVFLMKGPDDAGIPLFKLISDFPGIIPGAVVYDEDFKLIPICGCRQDRFNCVGHIRLRIIARNGDRQYFHGLAPRSSLCENHWTGRFDFRFYTSFMPWLLRSAFNSARTAASFFASAGSDRRFSSAAFASAWRLSSAW